MLTASLDVLMENTFNQVSDMFEGDFGELGLDDDGIEESLEIIDSRLDVDSVLIEEIKFDLDSLDYNFHSENNVIKAPDKEIKIEDSKQPYEVIAVNKKDIFSPQQRDRCNTWPRKEQERTGNNSGSPSIPACYPGQALSCVSEEDAKEKEEDVDSLRSSVDSYKCVQSGRRNPWGNLSYADLITQAIQSAPDRRQTLSQIYDWMAANVPYFSERNENSSSTGWKNSIRHNLSLHQKFLKIPNEGAGKSSWWTLNPENSPVKKPRRRATSGDLRTLQNKREKANKRVEILKINEKHVRSTSINSCPPLSPSYNSSTGNEIFRSRSNSNNHDGVFSSFRSRNLSSSSSTAPESPLHLDDLSSQNFSFPTNISRRESYLDNITLDDLNIESEPLALESFKDLGDSFNVNSAQKLKILEPRQHPYSRQTGNYTSSKADLSESNMHRSALSYVTPLRIIDKHEHDEVRKMMIIKQLNQLTQKRLEVMQEQTNNTDNKVQSEFEMKIMLLQDELNKLTRDQEMLTMNQYSSSSNNPYFSFYNSYRPIYNGQIFSNDMQTTYSHSMDTFEDQIQKRKSCNQELNCNLHEHFGQGGSGLWNTAELDHSGM